MSRMRVNETTGRIVTNFCTGVGGPRLNCLFQFLWLPHTGFRSCGESNFGLLHWLASSPLQHSRTTVRVCNRDLKIWLRSHSRSLKLVPSESFGAVSYSLSVVTLAVSLAFCEIFSVKDWSDLENSDRVRLGYRMVQKKLWRYVKLFSSDTWT